MHPPQKAEDIKPPISVFTALRDGLDLTSSKLWLVLIPLILDLVIWVGPRLSFKPVLEEPYEQYVQAFDDALALMDADTPALMEPTEALFLDQYFFLIGIPPFLGMPSVISNMQLSREVLPLPVPISPPTIQIQTWGGVALVFGISILLNITLFTLFSILVANSVHASEQASINVNWAQYIMLTLAQFLIALIIIILLMFLLLFPFLLPSVLLGVLGGAGSNLLTIVVSTIVLLGWVLILWLGTFIVFTGHGITLHRKHIIAALWDSIRVVQWNRSATTFMLLTTIILYVLFRMLWYTAPTDSPATLIAIIGNAFINTSLLATTYIYYQDRHRYWEEMRAYLKAQLEAKRAQNQSGISA